MSAIGGMSSLLVLEETRVNHPTARMMRTHHPADSAPSASRNLRKGRVTPFFT